MTDNPAAPPEPPPVPTPEAVVRLRAFARQKRALAAQRREEWGDPTGARFEEIDAAQMEKRAADGLEPLNHTTDRLRPGRGGEMVAGTRENYASGFVDTVRQRPDMLTADASVKRVELLTGARAVTLGMDLAETIQAQNSAERALAHQLAAAHALAMRMIARAHSFTDQSAPAAVGYGNAPHEQGASVEAARMAGAAVRLMETYQRGLVTLDRLRNGGRQVVTVQHVHVAGGAQAVVAGSVQPAGGGTAPGGDAE